MSKKFDGSNVRMPEGPVMSQLEQATGKRQQQAAASPEEAQKRREKLKTQGRKGCKASRINMALTPENTRFIKVMSRVMGMSMTEFTNLCVEEYRKLHHDGYDKAVEAIEAIEAKKPE